ncbi:MULTISPECIES: tyrosine--tRNA ligase [Agrobacterium]|jgi:tyrosyl-tRNA synthetase|uniref:Tyrosine--tRNA ligase n=2 Tax=Agrobacterium tumefaciens complex TaxID=1183400 RepID=A0A1S7NMJ8_AGRTU|nr:MULTISPECIES: tyrosine--tRNA ligase [Agrobacterium tumefaciens complex]TGE80281.1 tyrosine--tRNA ligase [Rhizobium sp. SEMIA 439]AYM81358.1 tyrosyl-tRNA synthetase [Agrobacterium tumefaciens]EHH04256.1 Tyrosyl-tRNA synthetase [Agrobacterium tumefaciens CCNWGS0286]KAA1237177.1 tyrosine--tRNA ligase [Agrobacterium tumefaciens]MBB4280373.1 tyrosyl-tRNA synthetase [Agrobacterium radiobacter]
MSRFKSDFLRTLDERGFIHQISDEAGLDELFAKETVTAYIGYDPTASSLHVGHLTQIMMLHWMQKTGHQPISLMGGGTGMVGDPSFKEEARKLMTIDMIEDNITSLKHVFANYLDYDRAENPALMINNADWLRGLNYLEFLRDVGRHFSVNRMLSFDSVKTRLDREQSLSFLEFNYMILQAYDFVELNQRTGCRLQMGGSDQWGNIINGIDLGHRMGTPQLYALTSPLLTTSSGAKMGKSASGAVWLNKDLLPVYDFWQYWRNTEDADVVRFAKLFTTLPMDEIARLAALGGSEINEAKKILATEVTAILHGRAAAEEAAETARKTFEEGALAENLPSIEVPASELEAGVGVLSLIVRAGLAGSNGEARRHVQGGAVKINDIGVSDERQSVGSGEVTGDGVIKLSVGKKKHVLVRPA